MTGYDFHPEARTDLDQIYDYIAADSLAAADRVMAEIVRHRRIGVFSASRTQAH
jgi:plasmid stabilization system protein ParE